MLDFEKRIRLKMYEVFDINQDLIKDDIYTNILLASDSMNHMNLIVALEKEFKCNFDEDYIRNMISFEIMKTTLEKKLPYRN